MDQVGYENIDISLYFLSFFHVAGENKLDIQNLYINLYYCSYTLMMWFFFYMIFESMQCILEVLKTFLWDEWGQNKVDDTKDTLNPPIPHFDL
jgi:hypothetical protein